MFKFRGQRNNGEWVEGHYVAIWDSQYDHYNHYIYTGNDRATDYYKDGFVDERFLVNPETLSVSTGKLDSTAVEIFASFEIDGVMTSGGDMVTDTAMIYEVVYDLQSASFKLHKYKNNKLYSDRWIGDSKFLTIIGKGGDNDKCRDNECKLR